MRKNTKFADDIASGMMDKLASPEFNNIFSKEQVNSFEGLSDSFDKERASFVRIAKKKEEIKDSGKKDSKKEDKKAPKKEEKELSKEDKKKAKLKAKETKAKEKAEAFKYIVDQLVATSSVLDTFGLSKSSGKILLALDSILKEATDKFDKELAEEKKDSDESFEDIFDKDEDEENEEDEDLEDIEEDLEDDGELSTNTDDEDSDKPASDYEICDECGFDHSYEPTEAAKAHKASGSDKFINSKNLLTKEEYKTRHDFTDDEVNDPLSPYSYKRYLNSLEEDEEELPDPDLDEAAGEFDLSEPDDLDTESYDDEYHDSRTLIDRDKDVDELSEEDVDPEFSPEKEMLEDDWENLKEKFDNDKLTISDLSDEEVHALSFDSYEEYLDATSDESNAADSDLGEFSFTSHLKHPKHKHHKHHRTEECENGDEECEEENDDLIKFDSLLDDDSEDDDSGFADDSLSKEAKAMNAGFKKYLDKMKDKNKSKKDKDSDKKDSKKDFGKKDKEDKNKAKDKKDDKKKVKKSFFITDPSVLRVMSEVQAYIKK